MKLGLSALVTRHVIDGIDYLYMELHYFLLIVRVYPIIIIQLGLL